ncbi:MAG TPA: methylmalonyl Co-A mutase-associated GTPase MeaB [Candidatus Dormibacteraeota bacterium]|nr:methylmalonyl Co-A mutase-associated GTPase MeaB [Candidatus Dormibacteraeota bacterium]
MGPQPSLAPDRDLAERFRARDIRALARAISLVERRDPAVRALEESLGDRALVAHVAGFTGAPGTGKSTLVDAVVALLRRQDKSVGVIATDPNSPFTGGAILGDRIRMQRHALDPKVYIRSMGARGHLGGLSLATREAIRLLLAFGFDQVILETVGVGQSELEVAAIADTTVVVLTPNLGDGVQMIKAGILEIADVLVVNKADLEGHHRVVMELRGMLSLASPGASASSGVPVTAGRGRSWKPPIITTVATRQEGIDELWAAVEAHRLYLQTSGAAGELAERRLKDETAEVVAELARDEARRALAENSNLIEGLLKDGTPYRAAEEILSRMASARPKRSPRRGVKTSDNGMKI